MAKQGQNVWYELMTTDVEGAKRFYSETLGWRTEPFQGGDPSKPYTMFMVGDRGVGGVMGMPPGAPKGVPPHWISHTYVDDVDKTVAMARELGGKVYHGPDNIPNVGRFAVLGDPQGAVFSVYKPSMAEKPERPQGVGDFCWSELNTTDYTSAWTFYSKLFGWVEKEAMDMGPPVGTYFMFEDSTKKTPGGMSNAAKAMNLPPHWIFYVTVDNMTAAIERIKSKGGKIMNGPMDVPGGDVIAQCMDPQGGMFAIHWRQK